MVDNFAGVRMPRSPVYGRRGMVVSGHSLASMAGVRVIENGGTLVDAMIATSAVLCVTIPQATSLGGDAFILYRDAKAKKTYGLNASGPAPRGATPDKFPGGMVARGPLAGSVPGLVRGWEEMHAKFGKTKWSELLAPAIDLAENGHPLSRVLAAGLTLFRKDVEADPGCAALYFKDGKPLPRAHMLHQPALARTLKLIAEGGSAAYYEGPIARDLGGYHQAKGGLLSVEDFKGYKPEWIDPIATDYRGRTVQVMPPTSFGLLMLLQLNALKGIASQDLAAMGDADRLDVLIRAMRTAFAEGLDHIADPRVAPAPLDRLLGAETTARMQEAVKNGQPAKVAGMRGGTSCIAMADAEGNAMTVVQSVFHVFGAAFLDPTTGILMNNRMMGFTTKAGHPNVVAPDKRPAHTLNPVMVLSGDKAKYLISTPGGPAQTISNTQVLTNLVDRGMELSEAIEAPRWSITMGGDPVLEDGYPDAVAAALAARGHRLSRATGASYFGSSKCLEILDNGVLAGAADPRREAFAAGV
jgi:gamma-glutamyltranspeptidase/glutathione hydrolase